jgi:hypothetical protein
LSTAGATKSPKVDRSHDGGAAAQSGDREVRPRVRDHGRLRPVRRRLAHRAARDAPSLPGSSSPTQWRAMASRPAC